MNFPEAFRRLTGNPPLPWQEALYERFISVDPNNIPSSCNMPTGLGKTSVIAVWLLALASHPYRVPRRLAYVVNRRTVVDQTTNEVKKYRAALVNTPELASVCRQLASMSRSLSDDRGTPILDENGCQIPPIALSTLRGQFADNREWSIDPSRPAVICGTVDMIGSRLLFSGYGVGFKGRPLHAGFLGQDTLLVHDEAHLEPAFQELIQSIEAEQQRAPSFGGFRVMELTATSRGTGEVFKLSAVDEANAIVKQRINATKNLIFYNVQDEKKQLSAMLLERCKEYNDSGQAILVFVRTIETLGSIVSGLRKARLAVQQLTGAQRGLERERMSDPRNEHGCPIFARFLPKIQEETAADQLWKVQPQAGTVFLVCTSAGEVGVNLSADHLVCDLTPLDSMAQRFGRVNRFGMSNDTTVHIFSPTKFDANEYDLRRERTLHLLHQLHGDGSPAALSLLSDEVRVAAFTPPPEILPTSDILFDAWSLTTIREKLPGRPSVEPYLHGISEWEPPQTSVAWREEVEVLHRMFATTLDHVQLQKHAAQLLEDYPLKNHELLTDRSDRVFNAIKKLAAAPETPIWLIDNENAIELRSLSDLSLGDKDDLAGKTILLSPHTGGLTNGLLDPTSAFSSEQAYDVADLWIGPDGQTQRARVWDDDPIPSGMSIISSIDTLAFASDPDETIGKRNWHHCALVVEGNRNSRRAVQLNDHVQDVVSHAAAIVERLQIDDAIKQAVVFAAKFHDEGKRRASFQRILGNFANAEPLLAKSGPNNRNNLLKEDYRHELGSLVDTLASDEFNRIEDLEMKELILHLIAAHHGFGRPHFPNPYDPEHADVEAIANEVPLRFARLQRRYGRWGLAYLESLLRAADWAASANPTYPEADTTRIKVGAAE